MSEAYAFTVRLRPQSVPRYHNRRWRLGLSGAFQGPLALPKTDTFSLHTAYFFNFPLWNSPMLLPMPRITAGPVKDTYTSSNPPNRGAEPLSIANAWLTSSCSLSHHLALFLPSISTGPSRRKESEKNKNKTSSVKIDKRRTARAPFFSRPGQFSLQFFFYLIGLHVPGKKVYIPPLPPILPFPLPSSPLR